MKQHQELVRISTSGRGLVELTHEVARIVEDSEIDCGLCIVFCRHTSCSLIIQENADPSARRDLERWLERIAPENESWYTHTAEGSDDMPSHLRAAVTKTSETIPIRDGRLVLGTWQGLFLAEHRARPHERELVVHLQGI